eukprot:SAG11_NODE_477_length_9118_cov_3.513582_5_plen_103_part_00
MTAAEVRREACVLFTLGWPSIVAKLLDFTPQTMLLWLVAPLGPEAVAVAGMGSFWVNVTGQSIVAGFGIGMVPLAAQAFVRPATVRHRAVRRARCCAACALL